MVSEEVHLGGFFGILLEKRVDECGFLARTWCAEGFERAGLDRRLAQVRYG